MRLTVIRIKPNPAGKDRPGHGAPSPSQLAAEWADFRNDDTRDASLADVSMWHRSFAPGREPEWAKVTSFSGNLPPGRIVRVHSGENRDLSILRPEDYSGAEYHVFTGRDAYVWNNREGDTALLFHETTRETIDKASYAPNPPEGAVLVRSRDQLVPGLARAAGW